MIRFPYGCGHQTGSYRTSSSEKKRSTARAIVSSSTAAPPPSADEEDAADSRERKEEEADDDAVVEEEATLLRIRPAPLTLPLPLLPAAGAGPAMLLAGCVVVRCRFEMWASPTPTEDAFLPCLPA